MPLVGLALRANLAAPVGVWLRRVLAMVPDPVRTGASPRGNREVRAGLHPRFLPGPPFPLVGLAHGARTYAMRR